LLRTLPNAPDLDTLLTGVPEAIRQAEYIRVNMETDVPRYGPRLNFLIGGNILGRGLTIDDLLVTYYVREAQVSQMDTVWQHARMYGYRQPLMPFTRVYLPARVAAMFRSIHESEEELRDVLRSEAAGEVVPSGLQQGRAPLGVTRSKQERCKSCPVPDNSCIRFTLKKKSPSRPKSGSFWCKSKCPLINERIEPIVRHQCR
jgi:hypothetical protein